MEYVSEEIKQDIVKYIHTTDKDEIDLRKKIEKDILKNLSLSRKYFPEIDSHIKDHMMTIIYVLLNYNFCIQYAFPDYIFEDDISIIGSVKFIWKYKNHPAFKKYKEIHLNRKINNYL